MASGAKINDECKTVFQDIKLGHKYRYALFGFETGNDSEIVVLKKAPPSAKYDDFVEDVYAAEKDKECRFAIFDFEFEGDVGRMISKILFFMWSPDTATIRQKMLYTASNQGFRKALGDGIAREIQANDHGDLQMSNVLEICKRL